MKVEDYLERIGFEGPIHQDADTLARLQRCHLRTVPYENLDILRGEPLSLSLVSLFDKVVTRQRGGYCFELNGLFGWLLRALGFVVYDHAARFLLATETIPKRRHRVLRVVFPDGTSFVCDVGVGIVCPEEPVCLKEDFVQVIDGNFYRVSRDPFLGWVIHQCLDRNTWKRFFAFTTEPELDVDYTAISYYCEKHPDSPFNKKPILARCTQYGGKNTINGQELTWWDAEGRHERTLQSEAEERAAWKEHFGIVIED